MKFSTFRADAVSQGKNEFVSPYLSFRYRVVHNCTFDRFAFDDVSPQRDQKLPRQRHNGHSPDTALLIQSGLPFLYQMTFFLPADPKPAELNGFLSKTLPPGLADALSTALFLLDREAGSALAEKCSAEVLWVDVTGQEFMTDGFKAILRT